MIDLKKIKSAEEWRDKREELKRQFLSYLGEGLSLLSDPLYDEIEEDRSSIFVTHTRVLEEIKEDQINRFKIEYSVQDEDERVCACIFAPDVEKKESISAILFCQDLPHSTKEKSSGNGSNVEEELAWNLAEQGYLVMIPDCFGTGESPRPRRGRAKSTSSSREVSSPTRITRQGKILMDYLAGLRVFGTWFTADITGIGVLGKGFGAMQAILLTAVESSIQACVAIGPLASWKDKNNKYNWLFHDELNLIPALRDEIEAGKNTFDIDHLIALCAPSAVLIINPGNSESRASAKESTRGEPHFAKGAERIYSLSGMEEALKIVNKRSNHSISDLQSHIENWFAEWL